jgi:osmotically-inducible protein OsmY
MSTERSVLDEVRAALRSEARIQPVGGPIHLDLTAGTLTMTGEVDHIAGKKLALEAAARVHGVSGIADRLHVHPATPMADGEIRD